MIRWAIRVLSIFFWMCIIAAFLIVPYHYNRTKEPQSINIFIWSTLIDPLYFARFEKETGITLNLSYYESNEELLGKLSATKGVGYDLIVPSDYTVQFLIEQGMLKPIDKSRLHFFHKLNPKIMNNYSDPGNHYSIPYLWGMYGIGINMDYYQNTHVPHSLGLVFNPQLIPYKVGMPGNAREVIMMAAYYLFGNIDALYEVQKRNKVKELLIQQKKYVSSYVDERAEYEMLSHMCSAILLLSPDLIRAKRENDALEFILPKEGVFVVVDNFVIPKSSKKDELIYTFLNYLYSDTVIAHHCRKFGTCSPTVMPSNYGVESFCPSLAPSQSLLFFEQRVPEDILNEIWMALMAS